MIPLIGILLCIYLVFKGFEIFQQIALQTGMRGCEIRGLQWSDVDLLSDTLTIRKSKTAAGVRAIPLTRAAFEVFVELRKRAELFGDIMPEHFVFARFKPVGRFDGKELEMANRGI